MKKNFLISIFLFNLIGFSQNEYYEIRKYELPFNSPETILHEYFSKVSERLQKNLVIKNFEYPSQDGYTKKHKYFILDN